MSSNPTADAIVQASVGAVIDATASKDKMRYAQKLQHSSFDYQNAKNREETQYYWDRYNSPEAKKAAYKAAGLNPDMLLGGSGQTGTAGTMTSAPSAPTTPLSALSEAVNAATEAERTKMSMDEMRRAHRFNLDAQEYELSRAEAESRKADAEAVKAQKEAGVFDERRYEEKREKADAHMRHTRDLEEIQDNSAREWRKIAVQDKLAQLEERKYNEGEDMRNAQYELLKGQKRFVTEQTTRYENESKYLHSRGYYPGSGASFAQSINDIIDTIMTDDPENPTSSEFNSFKRRIKNLGYKSKFNQRTLKEIKRYYPEKVGIDKDGYYYRK